MSNPKSPTLISNSRIMVAEGWYGNSRGNWTNARPGAERGWDLEDRGAGGSPLIRWRGHDRSTVRQELGPDHRARGHLPDQDLQRGPDQRTRDRQFDRRDFSGRRATA